MVTDFGIDLDASSTCWHLDYGVYCRLARNSLCPGYGGDDASWGILIKRQIMSLRDSLYLLGIMVLVFAAAITGHWDYLGHMLDGAILMLLYLKGKEK